MSTTSCDTIAAEELVAYVDGEQLEPERTRIEGHVSSCLTCRREIERLSRLHALIADLPAPALSPDFEARMWERLASDPPAPRGRRQARAWRWAAPPLAAAAALALVWYWWDDRPVGDDPGTAPPAAVAVAPDPSAGEGDASRGAEPVRRAEAPATSPPADAEQVVAAELAPEDLPADLLARPELYLRLPVVRRLDTLENFEQVRRGREGESIG